MSGIERDPRVGRSLDYWKSRLASAPALLELPTDRPRARLHRAAAETVPVAISAPCGRALVELAERHDATLFMALLAAWQVVLSRYSGQRDIVIGTLVGAANPLALRTDFPPDATFGELLTLARATTREALEHQHVPFEQVLAAVNPVRHDSYAPLFQVMLLLREPPFVVDRAPHADAIDLLIELEQRDGAIAGCLTYSTALFERATAARMVGHLTRLLEAIVASPETTALELAMLSAEEERQLLVEWSGSPKAYPKDMLLHELFAAQAQRAPDAPAVTYEGHSLTYRELDERSNQLARFLQKRGVGPEILVGLSVERSLEMVVGLLGILKAGGAYLPLDPSYPVERFAYMLADSRVRVLLTQEALLARHAKHDAEVVCLDRDWQTIALEPTSAPASQARPENLAYVIYTSGSTGKPKGAQIAHASVSRLLSATEAWFEFGAADVWTLFHSYAFDFSVWELWGALAYGGRVVVVPSFIARDSNAFHRLLVRERVTVLNQTPSAFYQLIRADEQADPNAKLALRCVVFGGEALDLRALAPWYARHDEARPRLVNMYGITETTVHVTYRALGRRDSEEASGSLIGRAIPDLRLYVLDGALRLTPIGVPGELHVAGAGLARGYLGKPELTAARFVPDPYGVPGERMYRTGDLVRWLADGSLDYLGRIDHQVKIRGFRVELGEIEAALGEQAGVRATVVLAREDVPGDKRLVAYVVGDADVAALLSKLQAKLPEHMVPSAIVVLPSMPLTPNGKIDRKALPAPQPRRDESSYVPPRTPTELVVADAYALALGLPRVGALDHFFALGGHSLTAMRVVAHLRARLDIEVPFRALVEAPSVASLAARIDENRLTKTTRAALFATDRSRALPLSFGQEMFWRSDAKDGPRSTVHLTLRLDGRLEVDVLERVLSEIVERHESLRSVFALVEHAPAQRAAAARAVCLMMEDLEAAVEPELAAADRVSRERDVPFDQWDGPLFRFSLFRITSTAHILSLYVDHITWDAWSSEVFLRELRALYDAFAAARPSPLATLPIQIGDFAAWQRAYYDEARIEAERAFWRAHLRDAPRELSLPFDRPRGERNTVAKVSLVIDAARSAEIRAASAAHGGLFVTMWTALVAALHVVSNQRDFVIGTFHANRDRAEVLDLIGTFANMLPVRARLPEDAETLGALRTRLSREVLDVFEHVDLPLPWIMRSLPPSPIAGPPFRIGFQMLQTPPVPHDPAGLRIAPITLPIKYRDGNRVDLFANVIFGDEIQLGFDFNPHRFDPITVERMLTLYRDVVLRLVDRPHESIADLRSIFA